MTSVSIEENILGIQSQAFEDCTSLESVQLPKSLKSISDNAFLGCTALSEINIPPETVYLGNNVFGSSLIEKISFPGSLKYIGKNNCPNTLKYIEMCDGIEFVPEHFADSCNNLREVNLPQTIKKIGYSAFPIEVQIPEECKIYAESEDARLKNLSFDKFEYEGTVWVVRYDESDISVEPEDKKQLEGQIIIPEQHREYNKNCRQCFFWL